MVDGAAGRWGYASDEVFVDEVQGVCEHGRPDDEGEGAQVSVRDGRREGGEGAVD